MSIETLVVLGIVVAAGVAVGRRVWRAVRPVKATGPGCRGHTTDGCGCGH